MQTRSLTFRKLAAGNIRPISWDFRASFDKIFDPSLAFFTLDQSLLDGPDLLAYTGDNVITEWDKYLYLSYKDRIISMEWTYELDFFYSTTSSLADITLNNYDNYFTKNSNSPIEQYLLPRRPVKLSAGFANENLPQFVGLTERTPEIDRGSRTASLHALDFLVFIFDKRLDNDVMYQDMRIDEILKELFNWTGVDDDQMELDQAVTTIPFAYFKKDTSIGDAVEELMKAEMGSLYMNESGKIVFKSRLRLTSSSSFTFDDSNVIDYNNSDETSIINSIKITASVREVQPIGIIYDLSDSGQPIQIEAGETITQFFNFEDPVTSVNPITMFTANSASDGSGTDLTADVDITYEYLFGTSMRVDIENIGGNDLYITDLTIYGTAATVVETIEYIQKDQDSIDEFEEQFYEIDSPFIQDEETAQSIATYILRHFSQYGNTITLEVKGTPAFQINDRVSVNLEDIQGDFTIRKVQNSIADNKFKQVITAQLYDIPNYFILSSDTVNKSLLDGGDVLMY